MKLKEPRHRFNNAMLIDDSELDNFINEKTLEANHFAKRIYAVTGARSALEFLQNLITMGKGYEDAYPEIIFIDINMPMMDGFQFIEQFRKIEHKLKKPKLVILTSSVYLHDRQKAGSIGKDIVFLNKPLTREMLEAL
jgi:CheY-like chemotaxis protein